MPATRKPRPKAPSKRGQRRGAKLPRRAKGVVRGSGSIARRKIKRLLAEAAGLSRSEASEIEDRYVTLGALLDQMRKLVRAGTATTSDSDVLLRTERAMARLERQLAAQVPEPAVERIDASDRAAFCERHLTMPDGGPFELAGREWQRDELWRPLDGFRLWPADREALCDGCRARAGEIVASVYAADETRTEEHSASGCAGLLVHVIWLVLLQLKRQQGKTSAVAGYAVSGLFRHARESMAYVTGSEKQSAGLFAANFGLPVTRDPALKGAIAVHTTKMGIAATGSEFALFPTSLAGATGGTRTLVIVDEARDVPADIFAALLPTLYARNGWRCPSGLPGHAWSSGDLRMLEDREGSAIDPTQERYGQRCGVCSAPLEPWCGRAVAMSSAQELDGSDADWFHEACEISEADPQPDTHVFRSTRVINPKVSAQLVSRTQQVLGKVRGLSDAIAIEAGGVSRRKGEPFLSPALIAAVEDRTLFSRDHGSRPAVGFLDTSDVTELTSLVLFEDDHRDGERPWDRIAEAHLKIWDPKDEPGGVIDDHVIEEYLDVIVPAFGLLVLCIDDRLRPWARSLLSRIKTGQGPKPKPKPWRNIVRGCNTKGEKWGDAERRLSWSKVFERFNALTIRLIPNKRQRAELQGARRFDRPDKTYDVREINRRVNHLDVAEGVAGCCLLVHELSVKHRGLGLADVERGAASRVNAIRTRRSMVPRLGGEGY